MVCKVFRIGTLNSLLKLIDLPSVPVIYSNGTAPTNLGQNFSFFRSKWVKNMRKGFNQDIQQQQNNKKKTFYYNYYPSDVYAQTVAKHTTYADLV